MTNPANQLDVLVECIVTSIADVTGEAINDKLANLIAMQDLDIATLQSQLAALNAALAGNSEGDQLTAQSILAQLGALDSRLDSVEAAVAAIAGLNTQLGNLAAALAAETLARQEGDAALQAQIQSLSASVDQLTQQVSTVINNPGGECDCAALNAAIAAHASTLATLSASDASQASLLASLTSRIEALEAAATSIASVQAQAAAAQAQAAAAAAAAAGAAAAAAAAQAEVDALEGVVAANAAAQATLNNTFFTKADVLAVDCVAHGVTFRNVLRGKMGLAIGQSNP